MKKNNTLVVHPFFDAIKHTKDWQMQVFRTFPTGDFFRHLRNAQIFVFDQRVTYETFNDPTTYKNLDDIGDRVSAFSIPFKTVLYLMTNAPQIVKHGKGNDENPIEMSFMVLGYLIHEVAPDRFHVFTMELAAPYEDAKAGLPNVSIYPAFYEIDLKDVERNSRAEAILINRFTDAISVKRIGIEHKGTKFSTLHGGRVHSMKYERLYYIANKEEYDYVKSVGEGEINWEYAGWWRGHWRAFYSYSGDNKIKDQFGRNVVDYNKIGKNRAGEYVVPGYTWVVEHIKGDPALAEITVRQVVKK